MSEEVSGQNSKRYEVTAGLTLAVIAAVLAVVDLGGGKYGDDEIIGTNEKANAYAWYQSKSLKETVIEQQKATLEALVLAGAVTPEAKDAVAGMVTGMDAEISRYKAEKREILEGSAAVGPEGQVLEKDGQKGQITGAKEWEATLAVLGKAGDVFDLSTLFLQLSMVLGAIGLVIDLDKLKWSFYGATLLTGVLGAYFGVQAFLIVGG